MSPQPVDQIDWERYDQLNRLGLPGLTGYEGRSSLSGPDVMHHAEGGARSARRKGAAHARTHRSVRAAAAGAAGTARRDNGRSYPGHRGPQEQR